MEHRGTHDFDARLQRLETTLLEVVTALGMLVSELAGRRDLALSQPEVVERALERGWETLAAGGLFAREEEPARFLFDVDARLAEPERLAELAPVALEQAMADSGAAVGAIYSLAPGADEAHLVASRGYPEEVMAQFGTVSLAADLPVAAVVRFGHPLWFEERREILDRYPELAAAHEQTEAALGREGVQGAVVPLTVAGRCAAVVILGFTPGAGEGERQLSHLAARIARALATEER